MWVWVMYPIGKKYRSNARATAATTKSNSNATTTPTAKVVGNGGRNLREPLKTKLMAFGKWFLAAKVTISDEETEVPEEEEVEGEGTSCSVFDGTVLWYYFCLKVETHNKMLIRSGTKGPIFFFFFFLSYKIFHFCSRLPSKTLGHFFFSQ